MLTIDIIPASEAPAALLSTAKRNDDWDALAEKLQDIKVGDWTRIQLSQLTGKSNHAKRVKVSKALQSRKLRTVSRILGSHLYIRVRTASDGPIQQPPQKKVAI